MPQERRRVKARFGLFYQPWRKIWTYKEDSKGETLAQFYAYKVEKLQELVNQYNEGRINLYFGDESHVCTEGYVPYGWQFPWEDICIPSQREKRLNIFGMIDYGSNYHGFSTTDSVTSELVADFLERFSMTIKKDTFIVLDNAKVHRSKLMKERRAIWEKPRTVPLLSASLLSAPQYCRDCMANHER